MQILQSRFHHSVVAGLVLRAVRHPPRRQLQDHQGLPQAQQQRGEQKQESEEEEEKGQNRIQFLGYQYGKLVHRRPMYD